MNFIKKYLSVLIASAVMLFLVVFAVVFGITMPQRIKNKTSNAYQEAYQSAASNSYSKTFNVAYTTAEKHFHVKNRITIDVESVKTKAKLEVYRVSDTDSFNTSSGLNGKDIVSFVHDKVIGSARIDFVVSCTGIYSVDLSKAQYAVDNASRSVTVVLPSLEEPQVDLDTTGADRITYSQYGIFHDTNTGQELLEENYQKAEDYFKEEFQSNEEYVENAKAAAVNSVTTLIKQLNPNIKDLQVSVIFADE